VLDLLSRPLSHDAGSSALNSRRSSASAEAFVPSLQNDEILLLPELLLV
jgi:hypothetical protein